MKPIRFSKILAQSVTLRSFRLALAAPALVLSFATAQAGGPTTSPAAAGTAAPSSNWIDFTIGGAFVEGNDAGMMRRTQTNGDTQHNGDFYGGVSDMQFSQALSKDTTLTVDGHAIAGLEDYEINLNVTKADVGYVKAGYKQFRTWYDGSGGFISPNGGSFPSTAVPQQWGQYWDDNLTLDRGEATLELGLRMENVPEVTFSYTHAFRHGMKDSLAWGSGAPSDLVNDYKLMQAFWNIDEKVDTFELDVEHTLGNTDVGVGLTYEHVSYDNVRTNTNGTSTAMVAPPALNLSIFQTVTEREVYTMDMFSGNVHSTTRFNDNVWLSGGFLYNTVNTDTDGSSRNYSSPYGLVSGTRPPVYRSDSFGGAEVTQLVGNLNLMVVPAPDLTVTPSVRYEHEYTNGWHGFNAYTAGYVPAKTATTVPKAAAVTGYANSLQAYAMESEMDNTTAAIDIRYAGIEDWVIYGKAEGGYEYENITHRDVYLPGEWLRSKVETTEQEFVLGANWYPISNLSFSVQGLYSDREQDFTHIAGNQAKVTPTPPATPANVNGGSNNLRPIMDRHETEVNDLNLRMTWRPASTVSLVTRYDFQETQYTNRGIRWTAPGDDTNPVGSIKNIYPEAASGNVVSHIVSESVTWSPMARLYLQGSASYTWSQTDTQADTTPDSDNDYLSGTLTAGFAFDDRTDITACFTYYGANNYSQYIDASNVQSMGYGYNTEEYGINVTLTRMLTDNVIMNVSYGYITSNTHASDQSGGFDDFSAHMVSTGLKIRF
jgi:hypothetical protein